MKDAAIVAAGAATALGMDGARFLKAEDPVELLALDAVALRAAEFTRAQAETQAVLIANAVGRLFGGKR